MTTTAPLSRAAENDDEGVFAKLHGLTLVRKAKPTTMKGLCPA